MPTPITARPLQGLPAADARTAARARRRRRGSSPPARPARHAVDHPAGQRSEQAGEQQRGRHDAVEPGPER